MTLLHRVPTFVRRDARGRLLPVELSEISFPVRRVFTVTGVPRGQTRGGHAHRTCWQALFCITGAVAVTVTGPKHEGTIRLDDQAPGLVIPPMYWASQTYLEAESGLLVLASEPYDESDYITDQSLFRLPTFS